MATSRDDFVIAIRSAFLKKGNQQRFSLIVLIFFSISLIVLSRLNVPAINYLKVSLNEIIYRASFVVSIPEQQLQNASIALKNHFKLYEDLKITKKKIKELEFEKYNSNYLSAENTRLRKLIDEYIVQSDELVAKVLLDKNSPFLKSIIVNKGSKDGVKLGMAVLDNQYLIGKIVEVNYSTSRALLVSDLNSKIPISVEPGNFLSILSGTGKSYGKIQYTQKDFNFQESNVVYTSGSGGIFKSGIPIGKVKIESNENIRVNFFSNLSQITFVKLISFEKEEIE
jgi:rod shape-determining protein MreC|tara:strand:+ start:2312 stop:3160 length:849 start_codon:yes stop_codon:yes gene_type:complete